MKQERIASGFPDLIDRSFERLEEALKEQGFRVSRDVPGGPVGYQADVLASRGRQRLIMELRVAREARRPELPALLSDALVRAQAGGLAHRARPVGVVGAPKISEAWETELVEHVRRFFPGASWGLVDGTGRLRFHGEGLEALSREGEQRRRRAKGEAPKIDPFSDLNQWMSKVLLAPQLPAALLRAPRGRYTGPVALARASAVSVATASRFVTSLEAEGFLDSGSSELRLVRLGRYLGLWRQANRLLRADAPYRFLLPAKDPAAKLAEGLRRLESDDAGVGSNPRLCLGLFAACSALGFGFVRGAPIHLYAGPQSVALLERLDLVPAEAGERVDVFVRAPLFPESLFKGAVRAGGVPCADVLQCWLDVIDHPARGHEQAEHLFKRVLAPALIEAEAA